MGFLENTLAFVFVLGVMVLIHELGHFVAARYFKIRVESFSIGFGPRLFGFRRAGTDFKVCLLPLGGYVKMAGENMGEPSGDPDEFVAKPRWQRLIVVAMGPLFNGVLAVALLAGLYMVRYETFAFLDSPAVVAAVRDDSPAARQGVQPGDRIVSLDGEPTPTWQSVHLATIVAANKRVPVEIRRGAERLTLDLDIGADRNGAGDAGWIESTPIQLDPIQGKAAAEAGIERGDVVVAIDGRQPMYDRDVLDAIKASEGRPLAMTLRRGDRTVNVEVTPRFDDSNPDLPAWQIGAYIGAVRTATKLGPGPALSQSLDDNAKNATLIVRFLKGLVEQRMSPKSLEGPIGIARLSGEAARAGWQRLIELMAVISLNLGIMNLLPIPILDGGTIVMLLLESTIRRDLSMAVKEKVMQFGLVFLLLLFAFVMYNDILKTFTSS